MSPRQLILRQLINVFSKTLNITALVIHALQMRDELLPDLTSINNIRLPVLYSEVDMRLEALVKNVHAT
jgi:hypothetical protein